MAVVNPSLLDGRDTYWFWRELQGWLNDILMPLTGGYVENFLLFISF
jgi:hypothetical protein